MVARPNADRQKSGEWKEALSLQPDVAGRC